MKQPNIPLMIQLLTGLSVITLLSFTPLYAQEAEGLRISGQVVALEGGGPLSFATVAVFKGDGDTLVASTLTDMEGRYTLQVGEAGAYRVHAELVGYQPKESYVDVEGEDGPTEVNIALELNEHAIDEIRVGGVTKGDYGQQVYNFSPEQVKASRNAQSLIAKMPWLTEDHSTRSILIASDRSHPLLLLNGLATNEQELRTIRPSKVIRVDYYDIAPGRYNTTRQVIDVITKPLDEGHGGEFSLRGNTLYFTGGEAFYAYHYRNHSLSVGLEADYMRWRKPGRIADSLSIAQGALSRAVAVHTKHYVPTLQTNANLTYTYNDGEHHVFRLALKGDVDDERVDYSSQVTDIINGVSSSFTTKRRASSQLLHPSLDLYYQYNFSSGRTLSANVVTVYNRLHEQSQEQTVQTSTPHQLEGWEQHIDKYSILSQVDYSQPLTGGMSLQVGARNATARAYSVSDNGSSSETIAESELYGLAVFRLGESVRLQLSPRVHHYLLNPDEVGRKSQSEWTFNPYARLYYYLTDAVLLFGIFATEISTPPLSTTTGGLAPTSIGQYTRTNAGLKPSVGYRGFAGVQYNTDPLYLVVGLRHKSIRHDIVQLPSVEELRPGQLSWVLTYDNLLWNSVTSGNIRLRLHPFGEWLGLDATAEPMFERLSPREGGTYSLFHCPVRASLDLDFDAWGASLGGSNPSRSVSTIHLGYSRYWYANLDLWARWGNWQAMARLEYPMLVKEEERSHANLPFYHAQTLVESNKQWVVQLGLSYSFTVGREPRETEVLLENEDRDAGGKGIKP